jgi:hypothetical protein
MTEFVSILAAAITVIGVIIIYAAIVAERSAQ